MSDPQKRLTAEEVLDEGLADWRPLLQKLHTKFDTGDFQRGLDFLTAVGAAAEDANHHPDVVLTYPAVEISLSSHDVGGITSRDIALARAISEIARAQGISASPLAVSKLEIGLDTPDHAAIAPFWAAVLGYDADGDEVTDPDGFDPALWFQKREEDDGTGQRFHLDVTVPHDLARQRIDAAVAAGGTVVDDQSPSFVVLADTDGNKACICTSLGRA